MKIWSSMVHFIRTGAFNILQYSKDIKVCIMNLYINLACLFVCPCLSNKRQNGWTNRAQFFCGISRYPREGLWTIKFSKICLYQNSIFENFENPRNFFSKIRKIFCFCFLVTRRTPVYFISNKKFYKWNKRWARRALKA